VSFLFWRVLEWLVPTEFVEIAPDVDLGLYEEEVGGRKETNTKQ
jgi:hypothetical protein